MSRRAKALGGLAAAYVVLDLVHFADHLRQGRALGPQIYAVGNVGLLAAIVVAVLALRNNPLAPLLAALYGIAAGVGVLTTHIIPNWWYFSDSYRGLGLDVWSWMSAWSLVVCGFALAAAGISLVWHPEARAPRQLANR